VRRKKERQKDRLENGGWRVHKLQTEERILTESLMDQG